MQQHMIQETVYYHINGECQVGYSGDRVGGSGGGTAIAGTAVALECDPGDAAIAVAMVGDPTNRDGDDTTPTGEVTVAGIAVVMGDVIAVMVPAAGAGAPPLPFPLPLGTGGTGNWDSN
jgi:hypothetical protein